MDFSPTGWFASYEVVRPSQKTPVVRLVEAWHPAGPALVVDEERGCLVDASSVEGFTGLARCAKVVGAVAALPGWELEVWDRDDSDSAASIEPIAAWLVDWDGQMFPMCGASDSWLEPTLNQRTAIRPPHASTVDDAR